MAQGKYAAFKSELAATQTTPGGFAGYLLANLNLSLIYLEYPEGGGVKPPPPRGEMYPTLLQP